MITLAIARRILLQFARDKRTLALLFVAPLIVLWLLSVLLGAGAYSPRLVAVDLPQDFLTALEDQTASVTVTNKTEAEELLRTNQADGVLSMKDDTTLDVWVEGTDSTKTAAVMSAISSALSDSRQQAADDLSQQVDQKKAELAEKQAEWKTRQEEMKGTLESVLLTLPEPARAQLPAELSQFLEDSTPLDADLSEMFTFDITEFMPIQEVDMSFLHGNDSWKMFDFYGPVFIGVFLFVFVFLTSGMSLVNERGAGTMTRFLTTPVKPAQILGGYTLGFGFLALLQSSIILWVAITFIGFPNEGAIGLVVFTAVSLALVSVTLGLLISGLASNAFQVIQLMLLFVVPQILLSGIFGLSSSPRWLQILSQCLPLTYGVDALRAVMLRGASLGDIRFNLIVLWSFIALFFLLAAVKFRKKRAHVRPRSR
ncbi:MAG: ABC transporter permease [Propionibacteriaceae bacterium]|nr:ABC transporter permease [Propionibacteriaceae bacterium]